VFSRRLLVTSSLVAAAVGGVLLGLTSYIPTFVQDVLGTGPVIAGFAVAALTLGWPLAASQSARLYLRIGFRGCALIGCAGVLAGSALLLLIDSSTPVPLVGAYCFVLGLGMGLVAGPTLIAAQSSVGWSERGVVTGNNLFCRSIGSAVAVAVFGAIANATLKAGSAASGSYSLADLSTATHQVLVAVAVVSVGMTVAVFLLPRSVPTPGSAVVKAAGA
jgi:MFS family permease